MQPLKCPCYAHRTPVCDRAVKTHSLMVPTAEDMSSHSRVHLRHILKWEWMHPLYTNKGLPAPQHVFEPLYS